MTLSKRTLMFGIAGLVVAIVGTIALGLSLGGKVSAPAGAATVQIAHAQGTTEVPAAPKTIVVYDLATLDTLDGWGVLAAGVPAGRYPAYLSRYAEDVVTRVGTLFEPDYEAVNALKPDLIIVAGRSAAKYAELSRIAPTIDLTVDARNYVASSLNNITTLGRIFGKEDQAAGDIVALQTSIAALKAKATRAGTALIVLTTGGRMSAYGPGSRFGVLHSDFGFAPAQPNLEVSSHGEGVNAEFVLDTDPDWLMVIDRDAATAQGTAAARQVLNNDLIAQTKAAKAGRIIYLDPLSWYIVGGGVRSLKTIVSQLDSVVGTAPAA